MRVWGEVRMADLIGYQTSAKMSATGLTTAFVRVPCHVADGPDAEVTIPMPHSAVILASQSVTSIS